MDRDMDFYAALLNEINSTLVITDYQLNIVWLNDKARREPGQWRAGKSLVSIFASQEALLHECVNALSSDDFSAKTVKTPAFTWDLTVKPLHGCESHYLLWDVTRTKNISDIALSGTSMANEFAMLTRTYRNGIFNIFNSLFLISATMDREMVNRIAKQCYRMHRTTINAEEYLLGQDDTSDYEFELVSMQFLLDNIISDINRFSAFPEKKIKLIVEDKDILVKIDVRKFGIAFYNVLANAFEASVPEGEITVTLSRFSDSCVITVSDHGVGIEKKNIGKIFEPFISIAQDGEANGTNVGLGLPAAKTIVENHGGSMIASGQLYRGTKVSLRLPLSQIKKGVPVVKMPKEKLGNKLSDFYVFLADCCQFEIF